MKDYKMLAVRYLQNNKKRTVVTIIGVTLSVMVLFVMLNTAYNYVIKQRERIRQNGDYEFILNTDDVSISNMLAGRSYIEDVTMGSYEGLVMWQPAEGMVTYVKVTNPYKADYYFKELKREFQVTGILNEELVGWYLGGDSSLGLILVLTILLISYIFAIFGVGIIRNSIQLSLLEQIRDYGVLRCIGATKKQLGAFIYLMGIVLEGIGLAVGIILGYPVSAVICRAAKLDAGFHFTVVGLVAFVFIFDLYFMIQENCKAVNGLSPLDAVRGEWNSKKGKLKKRGKGLFGRLFGIEGEYAYKCMMCNPSRVWKTVAAIAFSIAAFTIMAGVTKTTSSEIHKMTERHGYYPLYFLVLGSDVATKEQLAEEMPSPELLTNLEKEESVLEVKPYYVMSVYAADTEELLSRYNQEYIQETYGGYFASFTGLTGKYGEYYTRLNQAEIACYGYDDKDLERYEDALVDGTLELSDHGIILLNQVNTIKRDTEEIYEEYKDYIITDYEVGDTIELVSPKKLRERYLEKMKAGAYREIEAMQDNSGYGEEADSDLEDESQWFPMNRMVGAECYKELLEEGETETFTIEAIVNKDVNQGAESLSIMMPEEQYFAFTGTDKETIPGIKYHLDLDKMQGNLGKYITQALYNYVYAEDSKLVSTDMGEFIVMYHGWRKVQFYLILIVLFVIVMNLLNIINTTASNLYLRRKELAQLRVIGMSKKRLTYVITLEGIITMLLAGFFGLLMGYGLGRCFMLDFTYLMGWKFRFSWGTFAVCFVSFLAVLCITSVLSVNGMKQDVAEELRANGD